MAVDGRLAVMPPNTSGVAAVSAGIVAGELLLDLAYPDNSQAQADAERRTSSPISTDISSKRKISSTYLLP